MREMQVQFIRIGNAASQKPLKKISKFQILLKVYLRSTLSDSEIKLIDSIGIYLAANSS